MNATRLKALLSEYGPIAACTYFAIFFLALVGFALAFSQGVQLTSFEMDGVTSAGVLGSAYVATKLTQPIRIAATLALTPLVAAGWRRTGRRAKMSRPSRDDFSGANPAEPPSANL